MTLAIPSDNSMDAAKGIAHTLAQLAVKYAKEAFVTKHGRPPRRMPANSSASLADLRRGLDASKDAKEYNATLIYYGDVAFQTWIELSSTTRKCRINAAETRLRLLSHGGKM